MLGLSCLFSKFEDRSIFSSGKRAAAVSGEEFVPSSNDASLSVAATEAGPSGGDTDPKAASKQ